MASQLWNEDAVRDLLVPAIAENGRERVRRVAQTVDADNGLALWVAKLEDIERDILCSYFKLPGGERNERDDSSVFQFKNRRQDY